MGLETAGVGVETAGVGAETAALGVDTATPSPTGPIEQPYTGSGDLVV